MGFINTSILHNLLGMQAANQLAVNQANLSKTITSLSTGLRINSPMDDAAGNAIAAQLNTNLSILNQGTLNAQDGVSVLQVAQGGLGQIQNLLNQMSSLATEASNAALSSSQRSNIQGQINALLQQVNTTVTNTTFGNAPLLDGSIAGAQAQVNATVNISSNSYIGAVGNSLIASVGAFNPGLTLAGAGCLQDEVFQVQIQPAAIAACANAAVSIVVYSSNQGSGGTVSIFSASVSLGAGTSIVLLQGINSAGTGSIVISLNFTGLTTLDIPNIIGNNSFVSTQAVQAAVTTNNSLQIQVGSALGQTVNVSAPQATTGSLFSNQQVNVGTSMQAQGALNQIAHALSIITTEESGLAASQSRMNAQVQSNQVLQQNVTASVSRITDVNVAQATTTLARQEILVQTATSMLGQANLSPQSILKLFP